MYQNQGGKLLQRCVNRGKWSEMEESLNINILDLIATKCSFLTFTKGPSNIAINLKKDSKTSLSYHLKIEGTHNKELLYISKTI